MPEEANEGLVRVYLENLNYLVTTNKKVRIKHKVRTKTKKGYQMHNSAYEVDIIAINPKTRDKIIGEVKGWRVGIHKYHFKGLYKAHNRIQKAGQRALKIINDGRYRNKLTKTIESIYGKGFRTVLFMNHINKKDEDIIKKFMKKESFDIITFKQILNELNQDALKFSYSNEPLMQLLRIQKRLSEDKKKEKL